MVFPILKKEKKKSDFHRLSAIVAEKEKKNNYFKLSKMKTKYHTDTMQKKCKVVGGFPSAGLTAAA